MPLQSYRQTAYEDFFDAYQWSAGAVPKICVTINTMFGLEETMKRAACVIGLSVLLACGAVAQSLTTDAFQTTEIVLYNQMDEFDARSPAAEVLAAYIKQLGAKAATLWKDEKPAPGKSGLIAVAIRPDRTMKLWVDVENAFQSNITAALEREMKAVGVPQAKHGPIAFAVHFDLWGGSSKVKARSDNVQIPQLWRIAAEAQRKSLAIPDDMLPLVWREEASEDVTFFIPEGYDLQELKPTGGRILRPKGWFYTEGRREHAYMWTISKEDPSKGPYETGVRIQCFIGVQEATGKTPKEFVQSFVDGKKKTASVISQRAQHKQGLFTRIGLEVKESLALGGKERPYHILYSCFWGDGADLVAIVISGAPAEQWEKYADAFDAMSGFELIDMKRFGGEDRTKTSSLPLVPLGD